MQQDNNSKHTIKATEECFRAKEWNVLDWPDQSCNLNPAEHMFRSLKPSPKAEILKMAAVQAWQSITREDKQRLVISMGRRLQTVIECKAIQFNLICIAHFTQESQRCFAE